jgi:hypothetical protein
MPDWVLFFLVIAVVVALSLAGLWAVRRWLPSWRVNADISSAVGALVMTLFALVLAFAAVNLYDSYNAASGNIEDEANSLAQITRDVRVFPPSDQRHVDRAVAHYIREVAEHEFPAMRVGRLDAGTNARIDEIFNAVQALEPKTQAQIAFYGQAVGELNGMVAERRNRISAADSSLPNTFKGLLLLTAFLSVGILLFLPVDVLAMEIVLVGAAAVVVGSGLFTIILLEYPFSGSVAVSSDPLTHGALRAILAQYP